jgi:putative DNA primase/helicase
MTDAAKTEDFSDVNAGYGRQVFDLSQDGHAAYFREQYKDSVRWDWVRGKFYVFRGHRWIEDKGGLVRSLVSESIDRRLGELSQSKSGLDFIRTLGSANVQEGIYKLLKKDKKLGRASLEWDPDADLLGVPNGVVDLRTGKLRNGESSDLITKSTRVDYKGPGAITATWRSFVSDIMGGDPEMVEYLQRVLGYSTTGEFGQHLWFLCHGGGRNGKSLLLEKCVLTVLGDYADMVARKVLQKSRFADGTTGELLELNKIRFALASEFSGEIDEDRVKSLTSGGKMIGRRAYNPNSERFSSIIKLWIDTNHLPIVNDDSEGFWRRLRALMFGQQFKIDEAYEAARMAEGEACLAWLVEGAMKYYANGLGKTPESVMLQVESYKEESSDSASQFSKECKDSDKARVTGSVLYMAYRTWALADGTPERELMRRKAFSRRMRELRPKAHHMTERGVEWALRMPPGRAK